MTETYIASSKRTVISRNSDKYSLKSNLHSNEYSFRNERIFIRSFRTNIRIFGIFVLALIMSTIIRSLFNYLKINQLESKIKIITVIDEYPSETLEYVG